MKHMSFRKKQTPKEIEETIITHVTEHIRKKLKLLLDAYYWKCENLADTLWICHNIDVPHRLQSGFNCGLVALRMAAEFLLPSLLLELSPPTSSTPTPTTLRFAASFEGESDVELHVTPLLLLAQELQFTNEGEMFSSADLAVLAERHYGLRVEVLRPFSSRDVLRHLLSGHPLLIPYDADKNYAPCIAHGHRPHWALVRGFIYKLPNGTSGSTAHLHFSFMEDSIENDRERPSWFHTTQFLQDIHGFSSSSTPSRFTFLFATSPPILFHSLFDPLPHPTLPPQIDDEHLYLICQHGKSRNLALWNFAALAQSNGSLARPDEARRACGRWRIPDDLETLRASVVLLFPPRDSVVSF